MTAHRNCARLGIGLLALQLSLFAASSALSQIDDDVIPYAAPGQVPSGYPADYLATVRAAENEGQLVIYSTTDAKVAAPLIDDFRAMFPRIEVSYEDLNSTELYHRFVAETQLRADTADILWSSAMDQQAALVSEGYALAYESPERANLPAWANWKDQAFATTYEPVVFAYNKDKLPANEVPQTHADLARLISSDPARFKGKVVSYDIEKSGLGFFLATQDAKNSPDLWAVAKALGQSDAEMELTTGAMARRLISGEALIGYNLLGAYTIDQARTNPSLGYVFPRDYTLVTSRILVAGKGAAHPNAAKLWIDYLLSKRGQTVAADRSHLYAVREDVEGENTSSRLRQTLGASAKPVAIGPDIIGYLNNQNYRDFILQWRKALTGK